MKNEKGINLQEKMRLISDVWSPKIIAELNDYQIKVVKIEGEFVWHSHSDTDELFYVIKGSMLIHLRDCVVELQEGEMYVVKKGIEHKPEALNECQVLLLEPRGVVNTGEVDGELTAPQNIWI